MAQIQFKKVKNTSSSNNSKNYVLFYAASDLLPETAMGRQCRIDRCCIADKPIYIELSYIGEPSLNVRTLCLGFLSMKDASGYEIKKEFEDGLFCHFIEASFGSIYPALSQLAADGLVTVREEEQSGKPDKKVYSICAAGHDALAKALSAVPARDKYKSEFLFEMLLQRYISNDHLHVAMAKQLADLRQDLASAAEARLMCAGDAGSEFVLGYGEAVLTAAVTYIEQKRKEMGLNSAIAVAAE